MAFRAFSDAVNAPALYKEAHSPFRSEKHAQSNTLRVVHLYLAITSLKLNRCWQHMTTIMLDICIHKHGV